MTHTDDTRRRRECFAHLSRLADAVVGLTDTLDEEINELEYRDALVRLATDLVDTIDSTGGVVPLEDGTHAPNADPEWVDLGEVYLKACGLLSLTPQIALTIED